MEGRWGVSIAVVVQRQYVRWNRPAVGRFMLNVDGSLRNTEGYWGAATRNADGEVVRAIHGKARGKIIDTVEVRLPCSGYSSQSAPK